MATPNYDNEVRRNLDKRELKFIDEQFPNMLIALRELRLIVTEHGPWEYCYENHAGKFCQDGRR